MTGAYRLPGGGSIDRAKAVRFSFDGRRYEGCAGDTLASALLANGVRVVGRSFRLHRPRGVLSAGFEETNAIVQVGDEPNVRATQLEIYDGLVARAVNAWPSARTDLSAIMGAFRPLLGPGFYYKTFFRPSWKFYAAAIRQIGGLGIAPKRHDGAVYDKQFEHCDVLVVGGGPAGLAAATAAARNGDRTILVESSLELGGRLGGRARVEGLGARRWVADAAAKLRSDERVEVMTSTTAFGWYDHNLIALLRREGDGRTGGLRERLIKVRAGRVVLATGATERPLVFANNDRPNVMLASAARDYAVRYGVAVGRNVALATNNDSAYTTAHDLIDAGVSVAVLADARVHADAAMVDALSARGVEVRVGWAPVDVHGEHGVRAVCLAPCDANGQAVIGEEIWIACDALCVSGGWSPNVHLFSQSGGKHVYDAARRCFVPDVWVQSGAAAGAAAGKFSTEEALSSGARAGAGNPEEARAVASEGKVAWEIRGAPGKPAWVDMQYDVTTGDIRAAAAENYQSVEHLKRYTTLGMALDQGKTSNVNGIGVLADALSKPVSEVGTTRFRPPFVPVSLGALAGRRTGERFHPLKRLPTHEEQEALGAAMEDYGGWLRPAYYPRPGEDEEAAVRREALHVRRSLGVFDASPLGKVMVYGPDAGVLLDRLYVNTMSTLAPGRCRYGLMLNEHGAVMDDGVVQRLADDVFWAGTTSGGAERIAAWMEEWSQCEWPDLEVAIEPVTSQWATIAVAGPLAGKLLRRLATAKLVSDESFPHMSAIACEIGGVEARIARVSFSGERSYEINVPAEYGAALWRQCLDEGASLGAACYGVEALMRLRLEKGFLHVGVDTAFDTYPQDVGFGGPLRSKKSDFVGRRSAMRAPASATRRQLVGIEPLEGAVDVGAHVLDAHGASAGWVTSSGFSPVLERCVALGLVDDGAGRIGEEVMVFDRGARSRARLTLPCAYDPEGVRLNA